MTNASSSEADSILLVVDARGVATVTLNRPASRNAWSMGLVARLTAVFRALAEQTAVRAVIVTGAGDAFSAGGDLRWMRDVLTSSEDERRHNAEAIGDALLALDELPQPLIARINGAAFGGGLGMACAADVVVASETARFGLSEVRLGIVPAMISPLVVRRIGTARARARCLSGATFGAAEAHHIGLVDRLASPDLLDSAVETVVVEFLRSAPAAVREAKRLFRAVEGSSLASARGECVASIVRAWARDEAREGISSFLERRDPSWTVSDDQDPAASPRTSVN